MKIQDLITILIVIISFFSCSDSINPLSQEDGQKKDTDRMLIFQQRNPNLPEVLTRPLTFDTKNSRNGDDTGVFSEYLGYGYKLTNGNFIMGDFDNITHSIINIPSIMEYDKSLVDSKYPNWSDVNTFSYSNFDSYTHYSSMSKTVKSGFKINFGFFSLGKRKKTTETFRMYINNDSIHVYGEMNIHFVHGKHTLNVAGGSDKLYARKFLNRSYINNLYNSTITSILNAYGDFVVVGYYTGGRAFASFMGNTVSKTSTEYKETSLSNKIEACLTAKKDTIESSASFGFDGKNGYKDSSVFKNASIYIQIKTLGGIQNEGSILNTVTPLDKLHLDLTSWRKSLNDSKNHSLINMTEQGLYPMSDFVLETNFKRRFDDTSKGFLQQVPNLLEPTLIIGRVLAHTNSSTENLYKVSAILRTRQNDYIILNSETPIEDNELRRNEIDSVFMRKAKALALKESQTLSPDIKIVINSNLRLNPIVRSPLSIELAGFNEKNFFKYYNESTNMEYLYDPTSKICFSFYAEDGDESTLDLYGFGKWNSTIKEKRISMVSLANNYCIIGL